MSARMRLTCRGGDALEAVIASVVTRLARDSGLDEETSARVAEVVRAACAKGPRCSGDAVIVRADPVDIVIAWGSDGSLEVSATPGIEPSR